MRFVHQARRENVSHILTLLSGDELTFVPSNGLSRPHPGLLKRYSTGYSTGFDDPYADPALAQFDHMPPDHTMPESPSIERDNKLLGFSMPLYNFTLLDFSLRRTSLNLTAQLHGMFFLAESQWPAPPDAPPPPPELTCYRRNLFQITGSVTLPRSLRYIMTDHGDRIPILAQELAISATESVEGNPVKIISVPWKTPAGGGTSTAEDKVEKEPSSIPLDTMAGQDLDADYASFPIQWKRLQFRIATANNGRRKELQQHFVIRLKVMATLSTGAKISIAEAQSGAIIVRGRSPRNFQSRKDFPLGNSSGSSRKHMPAGVTRTSTGGSPTPQITSAPKIKSPPDEVPQVPFHYENSEVHGSSPDLSEWQHLAQPPTVPEPLPTPTYSASMIPPAHTPFTQQSSPDLSQNVPFTHPNIAAMNAPVSLSFSSDDEGSPVPRPTKSRSRPPTSNPSPQLGNKPRATTLASIPSPGGSLEPAAQRPRYNSQQPSVSAPAVATITSMLRSTPSPMGHPPTLTSQKSSLPLPLSPEGGSTDQLYEYFPLGLDDWMPPVDAIYRPHVVHHTGPLPLDPKAVAVGRSRSKRYFSEDG